MTHTLDNLHTALSYVKGSLRNVTIVKDDATQLEGFTFSLLNPPVPLGGNVTSLDIYVDELPIERKDITIATARGVFAVSTVSETRPIPFHPYQNAKFLIIREGGLRRKKPYKFVIVSKLEGFELTMVPFTFVDSVSAGNGKIFVSEPLAEPDTTDATFFHSFSSPLVLAGKKAHIICSSNGSLSAGWNWMGVSYDNGGLYVPPVRAFGRIHVEISSDSEVSQRFRLHNFTVWSRHTGGVLSTRHEVGGLRIMRRLAVPFENRGFIMAMEIDLLNSSDRVRKKLQGRKVRIHFLVDGNITSYGLAAISQSTNSAFNSKHNCLQINTKAGIGKQYFGTIGVAPKSLRPVKVLTETFDNDLELSYDLELVPGRTIKLALIGTGAFSSREKCLGEYRQLRDDYERILQDTEAGFSNFNKTTAVINPSGNKRQSAFWKLATAFEKAKVGLRYLMSKYDGLGYGISAGLPRFPNYWARDTGWALRGYLAIGEYRFAREVIDNFLRHRARNLANGAIKGELPMVISGSAFLHNTTYGSADSTFLFPWALLEYANATGDVKYLKQMWPAIVELIDSGSARDIDGDGLLENGFSGLAEKFPIRDSTWMDHIDRKKSANDIQALYYDSLASGARLAALVGDSEREARWKDISSRLRDDIEERYWNSSEGFYFDTIRKDGSKDPSIRPNALVLLLTGAIKDRDRARSVLDRIERQDMTTDWGVRTLSSSDEKYSPTFYHDGAVWPLVTGWAAISELRFGRREQGLRYIESMANRIIAENGMFAETYRGDRPEPFNSCILQAWSMGMYTYAVREMLLGMTMNIPKNRIDVEPQIPESLKDNSQPIAFEQHICNPRGPTKIDFVIDPRKQEISAVIKGPLRPFIASNTYSVNVSVP